MVGFTVSAKEWRRATEYFSNHPDELKYSRKESKLSHSFIKINNIIYAKDHKKNKQYLGFGGITDKVKLLQDQKGALYVIKRRNKQAQTSTLALEIETETNILKELNRYYGDFFRNGKNYTIESYIEGQSLEEALKKGKYKSFAERLVISFKIASEIQKLHKKNIIHGDLKPSNFRVFERQISVSQNGKTKKHKTIEVNLIDFNGSILKNSSSPSQHSSAIGTVGYSDNKEEKDFLTDAYALAVFLAGKTVLVPYHKIEPFLIKTFDEIRISRKNKKERIQPCVFVCLETKPYIEALEKLDKKSLLTIDQIVTWLAAQLKYSAMPLSEGGDPALSDSEKEFITIALQDNNVTESTKEINFFNRLHTRILMFFSSIRKHFKIFSHSSHEDEENQVDMAAEGAEQAPLIFSRPTAPSESHVLDCLAVTARSSCASSCK